MAAARPTVHLEGEAAPCLAMTGGTALPNSPVMASSLVSETTAILAGSLVLAIRLAAILTTPMAVLACSLVPAVRTATTAITPITAAGPAPLGITALSKNPMLNRLVLQC